MSTHDQDVHSEGEHSGRRGPSIASIVAVVAVSALVLVWLLRNRETVSVDWLLTSTDAPLAVVMIVAAVLGWIVGVLTMVIARRRRRKD